MFSRLQFSFLQFNDLNRNLNASINVISDMQSWLSGQSVALSKQEISGSIQTARFCPSGTSAPTFFKSSEAKPSLSSRHGGLHPRGHLCLPYIVQTVEC
jgi:hypothetical protein